LFLYTLLAELILLAAALLFLALLPEVVGLAATLFLLAIFTVVVVPAATLHANAVLVVVILLASTLYLCADVLVCAFLHVELLAQVAIPAILAIAIVRIAVFGLLEAKERSERRIRAPRVDGYRKQQEESDCELHVDVDAHTN